MVKDELVRAGEMARVAVLSTRDTTRALVAGHVPSAQLVEIHPAQGSAEAHAHLAAQGRFDLIVVDVVADATADALRRLVGHLGAGGVLVASVVEQSEVGALVGQLAAQRVTATGLARYNSFAALGGRLEELQVTASWIRLVMREPVLAALREEEAESYLLAARGSRGQVVETVPAVHSDSRATVVESAPNELVAMSPTFAVPALQLRRYHEVQVAGTLRAMQHNVMLPETYRRIRSPRLGNRRVHSIDGRFAVPVREKRVMAPKSRLDGDYYYLDNEFAGHFGHVMTEQIGKLWAWERAKELAPGLRLLVGTRGKVAIPGWERSIYVAAGVRESDLVAFRRPVAIERLWTATSMFGQPHYVAPGIATMWNRVGERLAAVAAPQAGLPKRIFCTRRPGKRDCLNLSEVETYFADLGFAVIHPEDLPIHTQALLFRQAEVVAGFAGSALFSLLFADEPKRAIVLSSRGYTAQNEYLISAVRGHQLNVVWGEPVVAPAPAGTWARESFHSDFVIDLRANDEMIRSVVA